MERYRLFYEGGENIHHGNGSVLPIMQNTLFAFVLSENSETSISVLENTGKVICYTVEKGLRLNFDQNENLNA